MRTLKLYTTHDDYHDLSEESQKGKGKKVTTQKKKISNLLMDHSRLIATLNSLGVVIENGKPEEDN
tara:strand:- start:1887 stop:2084 length:198 start_codon:yes stop_codon:yes gene_type:complete